VGRVVGVVVRRLRRADLVLEARQGDAVGAGVAVHPQVAAADLGPPLEHDARELVARAEQAGRAHVDVGVLRRPLAVWATIRSGSTPANRNHGSTTTRP
jgi:hypothetical protein